MADIPIMFSTPMIRALLAGDKTMTRRRLYSKRKAKGGMIPASATVDMRFPPPIAPLSPEGFPTDIAVGEYYTLGGWQKVRPPAKDYAGDRLWVRERYAPKAVGWYFETDTDGTVRHAWQNPMYMPRAVSRLTLVVTAVKIEPLQSISYADVLAEGVPVEPSHGGPEPHHVFIEPGLYRSPRLWFRMLWESLHGPESWALNPPVVAISFTVHQCSIDAMQERAA